ncbi:hypothetical protein Kpol_2001p36 [Vanderwaltozyma polyspora DSM 70294]|uniref:Uncharacterized protein n=1 Tax=Vanderwaltozyma polyspora (strain ATCC 22028 / DSM 70294 / BCRC 21397 / CBS 2163 / NBRC 10782 / NRRL Y-8283 / UCD 57-17) TaxID=436907 RepID=A7TGR8_VANPO|nr:uncharacterized protein Kpol_2001p36 [Vanderwaltozyma polyspora DSM 70294]EDO18531.1 hypothetical protein Kpol_2001p36 [Vanderwaltozyma polyspora DSM 70294]
MDFFEISSQTSSDASEVKNGNSRRKYLVAPFEQEEREFYCECQACEYGVKYGWWMPKFFFFGVIFPLFWIANIGIYIGTQLITSHEITHSELQDDELPTLYEQELIRKRSDLEINSISSNENSDSDDTITNPFDDLNTIKSKTRSRSMTDSDSVDLSRFRAVFLRKTAEQIVESHDSTRSHFNTWTLRSIMATIVYGILIALIIIACKKSSH